MAVTQRAHVSNSFVVGISRIAFSFESKALLISLYNQVQLPDRRS